MCTHTTHLPEDCPDRFPVLNVTTVTNPIKILIEKSECAYCHAIIDDENDEVYFNGVFFHGKCDEKYFVENDPANPANA